MSDSLFTWIQPNTLIASRRAETSAEAAAWQTAGVTLVINLDTVPDDRDLLASLGVAVREFPIPDFTAPDVALLSEIVRVITHETDREGVVCVHCRAGLGRTGTIIAAWMVRNGMSADQAIALVRELRPGSVETAEQVAVVRAFARLAGTETSG